MVLKKSAPRPFHDVSLNSPHRFATSNTVDGLSNRCALSKKSRKACCGNMGVFMSQTLLVLYDYYDYKLFNKAYQKRPNQVTF